MIIALQCGFVLAQDAAPAASSPTEITNAKLAGVSTNANPAAEMHGEIKLAADFSLGDALANFAQNSGITFQYGPELLENGQPGPILRQPAGPLVLTNVTFVQAMEQLLARNNLVLGTYPDRPGLFVAAAESGITPFKAAENLDALSPQESANMDAFFDPNKEVPLLTAIQMLGRLAKLNILIDPKVKTGGTRQVGTNIIELPPVATNTVSLSSYGGVSPHQALEAVLNNFGLVLITDPRTQFSQVTFRDPAAKEPMYTYVIRLEYSSVTNIVDLIQATFPTSRVRADHRTAQLVLLSTQKEYESITNLIWQLDTPTRQVLIEARFLETFQNPKSLKGIDWTDTLQGQRFTFGNGTISGGTTDTTTTRSPGATTTTVLPSGRVVQSTSPSSTTSEKTSSTITDFSSTAVSLSTAGGFNPSTAFLNAQGVNAVLSFLNSESDTKVLATPRAVTLDNMETRLEVTRSIPIFDASEGIGQAGTTVSSTKPNYTNIGTILLVTPRITGSNVALRVRPEISRVEPTPSRKIVAGKVNEADIFASSKIDTSVLIPSGNTLVMGGLISDSTSKGYSKVPFLGDIPLLGYAFRRESKERSKANLIIFVTPTIVEGEDFQPYRTDFLNTKMPEHSPVEVDFKDSGKPAEWDKNKKKQASDENAF
ncbi:MAG: hypothetical protein SFY81_09650 [Verrucomicrobiota bacterium]|nr:hypothetical protein [Verrucomicrobiota bacterium]